MKSKIAAPSLIICFLSSQVIYKLDNLVLHHVYGPGQLMYAVCSSKLNQKPEKPVLAQVYILALCSY